MSLVTNEEIILMPYLVFMDKNLHTVLHTQILTMYIHTILWQSQSAFMCMKKSEDDH